MVLPVNVVKGNFLQSTNHNKFRASFFPEKARVVFVISQIKEKRQLSTKLLPGKRKKISRNRDVTTEKESPSLQ